MKRAVANQWMVEATTRKGILACAVVIADVTDRRVSAWINNVGIEP